MATKRIRQTSAKVKSFKTSRSNTFIQSNALSRGGTFISMKDSSEDISKIEEKLEVVQANERRQAWKSFAKTILRNAMLMAGNIGMLVLGAYLFKYLEGDNEIGNCVKQREEHWHALNKTNDLLKVKAAQIGGMEVITEEAKLDLEKNYRGYLKEFATQVSKIKYNGRDCSILETWTFSNSLMFALTIITTIGYGVLSPATVYGRGIAMIYAFITIPLYMIALAVIGEALAALFKRFYWFACCCGCCWWKNSSALEEVEKERRKQQQEETIEDISIPLILTLSVLLIWVLFGAAILKLLEPEWKFLDSAYFCFITISTIGFGDLVPSVDLSTALGRGRLAVAIIYITVGMSAISMCFQLMADEIVSKIKWISEKCGTSKSVDQEDVQAIEESNTLTGRNSPAARLDNI